MRLAALMVLFCAAATAQIRLVADPGKSPLVTFRIVFETGSAHDPPDKPGAAYLTAMMLAQGGTKALTYKQILDAFFPMAVNVSAQVDKEMTTFAAQTHVDNLEKFHEIFLSMLRTPGWRQEDFQRVKDDAINFLRVSLRSNNDEELGKEVLYTELFSGSPYEHHSAGTISSLEKMTLEDVQEFYRRNYTQDRLYIAVGGGYPRDFARRLRKDFSSLPEGAPLSTRFEVVKIPPEMRMTIVEKDTRSVAYSLGFPMMVRRGHPDFVNLLIAQAYFGQHRSSGGRLFERMRQVRGLNYGNYSYIEYFPRGMFQFEPDPNLGRKQHIFQIWIRPVEPENSHFALRLALFEFDRFVKKGMTEEDFQKAANFLGKYVDLLMKTKDAELGYKIDSIYYQIPDYVDYVRKGLRQATRESVNKAVRAHLGNRNFHIVAVARDAEELKRAIAGNEPSPITYNAPKPDDVLEEDKVVQNWKIDIDPEDIRIIPVNRVFR